MLTLNSETESECLQLTPASRTGETRIKSAWLCLLARIQCALEGGCVTGKRDG